MRRAEVKKTYLAVALGCAFSWAPIEVSAQSIENVIRNPCERGPVPTWKIINHARLNFTVRLREIRPDIPFEVAASIADTVCDDLGMLYDSDELTRRTNLLISSAGY